MSLVGIAGILRGITALPYAVIERMGVELMALQRFPPCRAIVPSCALPLSRAALARSREPESADGSVPLRRIEAY
jgi:hypothetical protein